ncbi:MAG: alpha/beta hydrolase [Deltaproteobacteria bacterium]|nr:alpha/beta hydrolase [Deltaproteobacteria bacterium]
MAEVLVGGLKLHVQSLGQSPGEDRAERAPALFLHGLVMDNLSSWFFTVAGKAAAERRVVLHDLRGHGRSERPASGYTLPELTGEIVGVLDALGVEQPVQVVGNSFGGLLAICLALEHPERVASLALVDALLPEPGWAGNMRATLSLEGDAADSRIASDFKSWLGRHSARKRNRLADAARTLVKETSLLDDLETSPTHEDAAYERITAPVLALYGGASDQRAAGERLCARLPDARLEIVPGATHSILWEATDLLTERLLAWLALR